MYSEYERTLKRTTIEIMVDMAAWFGELNDKVPLTLISRSISRDKRPLHCRNSLLVDESIYRCIIFSWTLFLFRRSGLLKCGTQKAYGWYRSRYLTVPCSVFFVFDSRL